MVSDCGKRYQKDIFEDFRALVGCDFISDLPHKKNEVGYCSLERLKLHLKDIIYVFLECCY